MKQSEIEHWGGVVRGLARLSDDDLVTGPEIAIRVVGARNVRLSASRVGARLEGMLITVPRSHRDISHAFAHELAELVIRDRAKFKGTHERRERAASAIGAAILAPARTVRRACDAWGRDTKTIASAFGISHTMAHLRVLEVLDVEGAVITREHRHVLSRNERAVRWSDPEIVTFAFGGPARPGLARAKLSGRPFERGRVAITVA